MTTRGERLRSYLLLKTGGVPGWQAALVEKSGVKRQTISKWTNPKFDRYPDLETLAAIAEALEVGTYEIIAAMDGRGPVLDLSSAAAESVILQVVERWARQNGLGPLDRGSGRGAA